MFTEKDYANAIRILSMDMVQKANSGHPGAPMGMADVAEVLWRSVFKHNPTNPHWANRDRFILSNGHGSALIYSLLHLSGYDLSLDDLKQFRQLHSKTPGHPEYGYTVGVETTTGPLGQGMANAVGFALAEKVLATEFNKPGHDIVDHYTYVFLGDGCLMEGVSHEACSLAGTWKLNKLIAFYDDNGISIDGHVDGWFTDNTAQRFQAYGWNTIKVDGHNSQEISAAVENAQKSDKPTLIICKTIIGFGSPSKAGTHSVHGSPLGAEEILATRKNIGWINEESFVVPQEIYDAWNAKAKGQKLESEWNEKFKSYQADFPAQAKELLARLNHELPADFVQKADEYIAHCQANPQNIATRKSSQNAIQAYAPLISSYFGGSADLTPSNLTDWKECISLTPTNFNADYVHYGVREFGMSAIMNGIFLHGGFIPSGSTFLTFVDYARNAVRMSALMKLQVIYVLTHDSIGVGEDGPTHQPIEHVSSLRIIPNLTTWRPADQVEAAVAWKLALTKQDGPTALILSRQNLKQNARTPEQIKNIEKGGYVLLDTGDNPDYIILSTGSEVELAVEAANQYASKGKHVRVVSMPAFDLFDSQSNEYKESVLPSNVTKRVAIEAGSTGLWYKYVGLNGKVIGLDRYGESAPAGELYKELGITTETVIKALDSF